MNILLIGLLCWALVSTLLGLVKFAMIAASAWRFLYMGGVALGGIALLPRLGGMLGGLQDVQLPVGALSQLPLAQVAQMLTH